MKLTTNNTASKNALNAVGKPDEDGTGTSSSTSNNSAASRRLGGEEQQQHPLSTSTHASSASFGSTGHDNIPEVSSHDDGDDSTRAFSQIIHHDSDTSCVASGVAAPFSPPPNAFQNLPMISRGEIGFTSLKPTSVAENAPTVPTTAAGDDNDNDDAEHKLLSEVSVSVAVSNKKKNNGILQIPQHPYPASIPSASSSDEESRNNFVQYLTTLKRSQLRGGGEYIDGHAVTKDDSKDPVLPTYQRRPSGESYMSLSDLSLESEDVAKALLVEDLFGRKSEPTHLQQHEKGQKKITSEVVSSSMPVVVESYDDSFSISSEGGSGSGYENESNTSSVSGSIINIVPKSMTTLVGTNGGSTQQKDNAGVGGPTDGDAKGGILGNRGRANKGCFERTDDEFSTGSEHSILIGKHPRRRELDSKERNDTSPTPSALVGSFQKRNPGALRNIKDIGVGLDDSYSSCLGVDDYVAPSAPFPSEGRSNNPLQNRATTDALTTPTMHHISLFESFDRNWEQTVHAINDNPIEVLELGRKCLAAFALVFGSYNNMSGLPLLGTKPFRWWMDEEATMTSMIDTFTGKECVDHDTEEGCQGIPIVVIRFLWKTCFFDPDRSDDADTILDSIQHILVKELCYLTETEIRSVACLGMSLDVYAEYGQYILCRFGMQNQVASWHSKFALALRRLLLDSGLADAELIIKRYAARTLPIHTTIGLMGVDASGTYRLDFNGTCADLRSQLFDNLLSDNDFIKARATLLGSGGALQRTNYRRSASQISGKNEWNLFVSTSQHMKDIEWCASLVSSHQKEDFKDESIVSCCLNALSSWRDEMIASYQMLLNSGKLTIHDYHARESELMAQKKGDKPSDANHEQSRATQDEGENNVVKVAESLLVKNDAWTMDDDSAKLFQGDTSKTFQSPRLQRMGRRKKDTVASSPLARILNININEIRTSVSIGRSLLALSEFLPTIMDTFNAKDLKESGSVASQVHVLQSSCLQHAIEALACPATTLTYILSNALENLDEDDLDDTVTTSLGPSAIIQRFSTTREESKLLLFVAGILSADAWYSLGSMISNSSETAGRDVVMSIFDRALLVLNFPKAISSHTMEVLCQSLLSPLARCRNFLRSNVTHSAGVYFYEQGDIHRADEYLTNATRFRRQILDHLRRQDCENVNDINDRLSEIFNVVFGGMKNSSLVSSASMTEDAFTSVWRSSISRTCVLLPRTTFTVDELESSLSLTLEYSALAQHAMQKYQSALALFQEALIIRNLHVGKHSLDVASLHFNMGVVCDDLEQYDQAISLYHESLRIRVIQRNKATSVEVISDLEDSLITTLKCMGNVYRTMHDEDNAICCYVTALEMTNKKFQYLRDTVDVFDIMGLHMGLSVPVPTIVFDEMKTIRGVEHFQMMNQRDLCHVFEPRSDKRKGHRATSTLKNRLKRMHSTVIKLVRDRSENTSRSTLPAFSSILASLSSTFMTSGDAIEVSLVRSSFYLGRVKLEQKKYERAAEYFETALRSKWRLDPASSSDSDSDFSRKSRSRKHQGKPFDEDNPEEGQIYYALGICNAALDDHERSVRCFLTALRYLRRSLRKVDSLEVARVLFDCATSYYYLCNFEQSVSYYGECLRILTSSDTSSCCDDDKPSNPVIMGVPMRNSHRRGIVLYCLAAAKAAVVVDTDISETLTEARTLLSDCEDRELLAYTTFLLGQVTVCNVSKVPVRLRSMTRIFPTGLSSDKSLSWIEMCDLSLNLFDQVKNECWYNPSEDNAALDAVKHLPLSGHICFEKGVVYELLGSVDQALKSFADASNLYRMACGDENVYLGYALHKMGTICSQWREHHALAYFNEALSLRKKLLGGDDTAIAETLYYSALVLARLNRYEAALERYNEALRIQMNHDPDSHEVARTLAGMGRCHSSQKACALAIPCYEGSVKIRKYRMSKSGTPETNIAVDFYGEECALAECFFDLGNVYMQQKDQAQAMRFFIQARDIRWRHVGSGTVDSIVGRYLSRMPIDELELLGLARCLHNIGVLFDSKRDYQRSIPHYEEALSIKYAIAGIPTDDSEHFGDQSMNSDVIRAMINQALNEHGCLNVNKATLSASVTHQRLAMVYVEQQRYGDAFVHFIKALRIQRLVLGKEHVWVGALLSSMGNALRCSSTHSETAIICYDESLRISRLRPGQNYVAVASAMFNIGSLHDSNHNFTRAMYYYQRALSMHKQRYSRELRQRLCSGLSRPTTLQDESECDVVLNTGEMICDTSPPKEQIREQYALVKEALRMAKRRDKINRGERIHCIGDSEDVWLNFEAIIFRFVETLSSYVLEPATTTVRNTIDGTKRAIESAAAHSVISAADALDYQFLLLLQE